MFARDVEGRIGMAAGFGVSVTRPVVLGISLLYCPPRGWAWAPSLLRSWETYRNRTQARLQELRKGRLDRKRNERKASGA